MAGEPRGGDIGKHNLHEKKRQKFRCLCAFFEAQKYGSICIIPMRVFVDFSGEDGVRILIKTFRIEKIVLLLSVDFHIRSG